MQEVMINHNIITMFDDLITGDVFVWDGKAYVCLPDIEEKTNVYFNAVDLATKESRYFDPDIKVSKANRIIVE